MKKAEKLEKELDELYQEQENILDNIRFITDLIVEELIPNKDVTADYPSFESFVGSSHLEARTGNAGFIMLQQNSEEKIFAQHLSEDKQIWTYFQGTEITKTKFLVLDKELDTQVKKCEKIKKYSDELIELQNKIDEIATKLSN